MLVLARLVFVLGIVALFAPAKFAAAQDEGYNIRIGVTYCVVDDGGTAVFCDRADGATILVQSTAGDPIGSCVTEFVNFGNFDYSCQVFVPFSTEIVVTQDPASLREHYGPDVVAVSLVTADQPIGVDRPLDAVLNNTRALNPEIDIWPIWIGSYTCPYGAGERDPGCEVVGGIGATVTHADGTPLGYCVTEVGWFEGGPFSLCTVDAPMGVDVVITLDEATIPEGYSTTTTQFGFRTPIQRQDGIRGWDVAFRLDADAPVAETPVAPGPTAIAPEPTPPTGDEEVVQLPNTGIGESNRHNVWLWQSVVIALAAAVALGTMVGHWRRPASDRHRR